MLIANGGTPVSKDYSYRSVDGDLGNLLSSKDGVVGMDVIKVEQIIHSYETNARNAIDLLKRFNVHLSIFDAKYSLVAEFDKALTRITESIQGTIMDLLKVIQSYLDQENNLHSAYETSWGMSTRIIGALIMVHGDDSGLVLPPRIAPTQARIIPIAQHKEGVLTAALDLLQKLKESGIRVDIDDTDKTPGFKFSEQEMLGIPTRIEIGPKDIENNQVVVVRRDNGVKIEVSLDSIEKELPGILETIQKDMYSKAKSFLDSHIYEAKDFDEMKKIAQDKIGFIKAQWCGDPECEDAIKAETGGFGSRCMPEKDQNEVHGNCVYCGKKAKHFVYWGKAY